MSLITQPLKAKFEALSPVMDERLRRLWAATEARAGGRGGMSRVAEATGLTPVTIRAGRRELEGHAGGSAPAAAAAGRRRRVGGGRKRLSVPDPAGRGEVEALVDPVTRGDPPSPLRWTCKSAAQRALELQGRGHVISARTVNTLLQDLHYSLQANRKTQEGGQHPDRDAQFRYINRLTKVFQRGEQPVVSVDTKKKELVGNFKHGGQEWQPQGQPEAVKVYDVLDPELGKAIPYGVYDLTANHGWVRVGVDHDTARFAVETLRRGWQQRGRKLYPQATRLLVTADGGGSNGSRCRLWNAQ